MNTYVSMLKESLVKKVEVLEEIMSLDDAQMQLLQAEPFSMEDFDKSMDTKEKLIRRIDKLDDGFETVYDRVREELLNNKEQYASEIKEMQGLITQITEKNVAIKAKETRVKSSLDMQIRRQHADLKQKRDAGRALQNYHNNMNKINLVDPQFMDRKN